MSPALAEARLVATQNYLQTGPGVPYVELYQSSAYPTTPGATPIDAVLLVTVPLATPIGTISGATWTISVGPQVVTPTGGIATWARWYNGHGDWAGDSDVSDMLGSGFVRLSAVGLLAGGKTQIIGGTVG